jgi:undecaprenyl diphosphate synthase
LPDHVREGVLALERRTAGNTGMTVVIALSYSSRWEITRAVKEIAEKVKSGEMNADDVTGDVISSHMVTNFMPDPDLLIRTGGECRLSNYLLWQCAYTEFYFCDTYWPDFHEADLQLAIDYYNRKERRFGKTSEQVTQ